jgi:hypothetical protein
MVDLPNKTLYYYDSLKVSGGLQGNGHSSSVGKEEGVSVEGEAWVLGFVCLAGGCGDDSRTSHTARLPPCNRCERVEACMWSYTVLLFVCLAAGGGPRVPGQPGPVCGGRAPEQAQPDGEPPTAVLLCGLLFNARLALHRVRGLGWLLLGAWRLHQSGV